MLDELINANEKFLRCLDDSPLFALAESGYFSSEKSRKVLLAYLKIWSNEFQKMVMARVVFSQHLEYLELSYHHLKEEYGHNVRLSGEQSWKQEVWDPVLEALGQWFTMKMMTLGDLERIVLVHLVREKASAKFHQHFRPVFFNNDPKGYFQLHAEEDCHHADMGIIILKKTLDQKKEPMNIDLLLQVQRQAWAVIQAFHKHLAQLCLAVS
ncbi:MAG: hypothetical protein KC505_01105 [Myxococcales bacterium]|nr:hypothetical protein [Myxococcales bacterium]USN50834.1 MAG: hypothetical protein H6731_11385 [Myxococcales bacterium]